ncbi:MAG: sugar-binding domain-containing protein [Gemmatimonadota bacterium]
MPRLSRHDLVKSTLTASLGGAALTAFPKRAAATRAAAVPGGRERLLLDRNWHFAFGHASDPARDFGFGSGNDWDKVGEFLDPSSARFDVSAWRTLDLPHDWAVELPFENAQELKDHGYKPLGRSYPATSIGWYRRVFRIPESDASRCLVLDFDGVYRDAIVALNGHYLGRNLSGYSPFRFDVTD